MYENFLLEIALPNIWEEGTKKYSNIFYTCNWNIKYYLKKIIFMFLILDVAILKIIKKNIKCYFMLSHIILYTFFTRVPAQLRLFAVLHILDYAVKVIT